MKLHTILLQKTKAQSVMKDTEKEFGVVCLGFEMPEAEGKELPSNDWLDEDGKDVYIPQKLAMKESKITLNIGYKGAVSEWESKMDLFMDYLTGHDGSGVETMVYMPYHHVGRVCRYNKVGKPEVSVQNDEVIVELSIELDIDNPRVRISLNKDLHGNITSLAKQIR